MLKKQIDNIVEIKVIKNLIAITFGVGYLKHIVESDPELKVGPDCIPAKVTNLKAFTEEFIEALKREKEDGTTLIHKMIDEASHLAIYDGCEGVEIAEE